MKALILAAGKGTRLAEITKNEVPKPLAKIAGKPIMEYAIEQLRDYGIIDIYIGVGYLHEKIEKYFGNGSKFGVNITYLVQNEPLGSGGVLYFLKGKVKEDFIVCPGDEIFDIDFDRFISFHKSKKALITMFSHPNLHPYDSDLLFCDKDRRVKEINFKNSERNFYYKNNVSSGICIISPKTLNYFSELKKVNLEHDFIRHYIPSGRVFAYSSPEYVKDVGTVERFYLTETDIKSGIVSAKNLKNKQKAIFLDRDGTINVYKGFIKSAEEIELEEGVVEAIKLINSSGYLAIIVSNQPVIARGEASFDEVNKMFDKIETLLGKEGAYLDAIYYCPHHPHRGYEGEVKELKVVCECRKPNIGLIKQAESDFNLDLSKCYIIGDTDVDMQTALNANIKGIKVKSSAEESKEVVGDFEAKNLLEAVQFILKGKNHEKNIKTIS